GIPFWNADGSRFMIPWMPREQNNLVLYTVNPADGSKEPIYNENQSTWIDWMEDMQFVEDGFFMVRDFDMWEQIYFQSFDGKRLEKITSGKNWGVRFVKVDMKEGYIYFTARREVSTRNDFYRVNLKSKKIERLSFGEYNFAGVQISPDNKFYVAQYSNSVTPTRLAVVDVKAAAKASSAKVAPKVPFEESKGVKVIGDSKGEKFDQYKLAIPQMLSITVDGYVLPAQVIWPVDLDSTKKYPVLVSMYGGPNAGTVMDTWKGISEKTQWWANEGVIQIAIDHRASGHCGKEGLNFLHRNLLNIELVDYIEWMKELHKLPFVNREKVGITGFSYGGSMTMLACTAGNDYFKYGIAGGGVYDWGLYDTHYTERYMDRPQDNPEGYANTQLFNKVARYKGDSTNYVKITHGSSDDNVHMQNTMQLIGALQDAGKQFDLMIYPGEFHGYRGKKSVHSTAGDYIFWYRHLLGKEAPAVLF
ncbi:MAG: prolyl oligopeptidase family serine peptidase, partial [Bacteroidales bacterium]|nr:prolyl oligopeptidase family serine peptidase [Bacteroidales bacterium]